MKLCESYQRRSSSSQQLVVSGRRRLRNGIKLHNGFARLRRGMTLIELILVLAIMVVVASLAVPAIQRTIQSQAIRNAADRIRVAMGKARVQAIRQGEVQALFYFQNGGWFDVAPLAEFQQVASRRNAREASQDTGGASDLEDDLLPDDIVFIAGERENDSRSAAALENATGASGMEMILFYPDGTSQDATVTIQNDVGDQWIVELRGLTGLARSVRSDPEANR